MKSQIRSRLRALENLYLSTNNPLKEINEYDYPSRDDIENIFSKLLQKEKNIICSYENVNLRRNLMIRILETFHNKEFTYEEARIILNDRYKDDSFFAHFNYLINYNFIEKNKKGKFKFCNRVKKWRAFGKL
jgi:hypothetical protein